MERSIDTQTPQQLLVAKEERREKREERRAKQRIANIGRAEKMHELRIQSEKNNEPQAIFSSPPNKKSRAINLLNGGFLLDKLRKTNSRSCV